MPFLGVQPSRGLVGTAGIDADAITSAKIADDQIDSEHYAAGSIDTAHIAANQVDGTLTKDALIGDYSDVTITASDLIMYGDATDSNNTKRDTVQGILDLAGGGGWEFVSAQTASSSANIDFTGLSSGYDYQMYGYGVLPATDATYLEYEYGTGGTPTYQTSGYDWGTDGGWGSGGFTFQGHAEQNGGDMEFGSRNQGSAAGEFCVFEWTVLNPADSGSFTYSLARVGQKDGSGNNVVMTAAGWRDTNEAVTALRVHYTSGNISVGYFKLFKRANA